MNVVSLENVSKTFGYKPLLDGVSFGVDAGEKVGVIGANGSGKTTLLRLVAGEEPADAGRVVLAKSVTLGYLSQDPQFAPGETVFDAVFPASSPEMRLLRDYELACRDAAGGGERALERVAALTEQIHHTGAWDLEANARVVLSRLGVGDTRALVAELSGGLRKRVALARALIARPDVLVLDEPTNHLDVDAVEWLEEYLAEFKGALLLVTHDRYFLDRVADRILEVDRGRVQSYGGNYGYYLEKKAELEHQRAMEDRRVETELRRELAWLQRGARARTTKEKARVQRVEELRNAPRQERQREVEISVGSRRLGTKVLELEDVTKGYGGRPVVETFTYTIKRNDRIGVVGPNGAGKTTLLDLIAGRIAPDSGTVERGQTVVVGYYDQEVRELDPDERAIDYVKREAGHVRTAEGDLASASQMMERFLFPPDKQYAPIGKFSGGEQRRLFLLRILMTAPNVLLLDEPTNDLDIQTLVRLEEYLDAFEGAVVVASHDRYFLDRTVDHVFVFEGRGRIRRYAGNYSAMREAREREPADAPKPAPAPPKPPPREETDRPPRLSFKEQRELETLEARITADEARKAELEAELSSASSDYVRLQALGDELRALEARLDADVTRWAELAERA